MSDTHMRLTVGHDPATALCRPDITTGLVTDPADVTCRRCLFELADIMREREQAAYEREVEADA